MKNVKIKLFLILYLANFLEFTKKTIEKVQILLADLLQSMISRNKSKKIVKPKKEEVVEIIDFNEVDNKFLQKTEKIKDTVKKELDKPPEKGSRVMNLNKIKGIIDPLINPEAVNKKK